MGQPFVPPIQRHLCRPTTKTSSRRSFDRLTTNVNSQVGDVVNPTGNQSGQEAPGGSGNGTPQFVGADAVANTGQSIPASTTIVVSFASTNYDTSGFWSNLLPSLLTVPKDGYYEIHARALIQNTATTADYAIFSYVNGVQFEAASGAGDAIGTADLEFTYIKKLLAGDVITLRASFSGTGSGTESVDVGHMSATLLGT